MDETSIAQYLSGAFPDVQTETSDGNSFFFVGAERHFPFATLVTNDAYDKVSGLDRPGVFRLNIGIGRETFLSLFHERPARPDADSAEGDHDFAALDRVMPHPIYGSMSWVCVLNPGAATWESVRPLLAEAHDLAAGRRAKRESLISER